MNKPREKSIQESVNAIFKKAEDREKAGGDSHRVRQDCSSQLRKRYCIHNKPPALSEIMPV